MAGLIYITDDKEEYIVFIIIDSKNSLDQFSSDTATHTKMPATRLRSAIAKGQNCTDIAVLVNKLTPAPVIKPSVEIDALYAWLQDNVDGDSQIHFDNDGEVFSGDVLAALPERKDIFASDRKVVGDTPKSTLSLRKRDVEMWRENVESAILSAQEVESMSEVPFDAYEATANELCNDATRIASHDQLASALAILEDNGLADISALVGSIARNGMEYKALMENAQV